MKIPVPEGFESWSMILSCFGSRIMKVAYHVGVVNELKRKNVLNYAVHRIHKANMRWRL